MNRLEKIKKLKQEIYEEYKKEQQQSEDKFNNLDENLKIIFISGSFNILMIFLITLFTLFNVKQLMINSFDSTVTSSHYATSAQKAIYVHEYAQQFGLLKISSCIVLFISTICLIFGILGYYNKYKG